MIPATAVKLERFASTRIVLLITDTIFSFIYSRPVSFGDAALCFEKTIRLTQDFLMFLASICSNLSLEFDV